MGYRSNCLTNTSFWYVYATRSALFSICSCLKTVLPPQVVGRYVEAAATPTCICHTTRSVFEALRARRDIAICGLFPADRKRHATTILVRKCQKFCPVTVRATWNISKWVRLGDAPLGPCKAHRHCPIRTCLPQHCWEDLDPLRMQRAWPHQIHDSLIGNQQRAPCIAALVRPPYSSDCQHQLRCTNSGPISVVVSKMRPVPWTQSGPTRQAVSNTCGGV